MPDAYPSYDPLFSLELVSDLQENGVAVLDPRNLGQHNVFLADLAFHNALNIHRSWVRYFYDQLRPRPGQG